LSRGFGGILEKNKKEGDLIAYLALYYNLHPPFREGISMAIHYDTLSPDRPEWLGGDHWILSNLTDVNVIFGKNSSGKSLLLRALFDKLKGHSQYVSPERAGEVTYQQGIVDEELQESRRGSERRGRNQASRFRQESISRLGSLKMRIGDIGGRAKQTPDILGKIERDLASLVPDFKFSIIEESPYFKLERYDYKKDQMTSVDPRQLSSGETETLTLALDILTICNLWELEEQNQRVLLIDEPDPHLHPDLQLSLAEFIVRIGREYKSQIFIATHSTTLLASLGQQRESGVGVIYLNNAQEQQKLIKFNEYFQKLSICLGGHALMGPLFNAPLLLVEGDDDYQIWSHLPRNPNYGHSLAVIPCEGDKIIQYQSTLEDLFKSLRSAEGSPLGYALIDGDKPLPTNLRQDHIKFLQLQCREAENLYLTEEVLKKLGHTSWTEASNKIIEKASDYGEKVKALKNCESWDLKKEDIKDVIMPIAQILDQKGLLWTIRLGKLLGERKPEGQLAEFLGNDVIRAIWGEE
jgi:predicted ATPase